MITFDYKNARISKLSSTAKKASTQAHELPEDISVIEAAVEMKKRLRPSLIIVIGIGGSNLGAKAVHEAINGAQWNLHNTPRAMWADTVDADQITVINAELQNTLRQGHNALLVVVSKSGTTTETIANFEILLNTLKRHRKDAEKYVMAITDKDSKLWQTAHKNGYSLLEIPKETGGRYSVFTAVGLFPLGMLGVNIKELLDGARWMNGQCAKKNLAVIGASLLYLHNKAGKNIYDQFFFATDLESLGKWHRQLLAESCGKNGKGITPTVSMGSTDLHSVAQLYLGGPKDKFTNFVITHFKNTVKLPFYPEYDALVPHLQRKELNHIMHAITHGTITAYKKLKLPFTVTKLDGKNEGAIGAYMQLKMNETIALAKLLKVNPYDQPAVEHYKKETRRILSK